MAVDVVEGVNDRSWRVDPFVEPPGAVDGRALGRMAPVNHFGKVGKTTSGHR